MCIWIVVFWGFECFFDSFGGCNDDFIWIGSGNEVFVRCYVEEGCGGGW